MQGLHHGSAYYCCYALKKMLFSEVKRIIGRKFDDPIVTKVTNLWSFKVSNGNGMPVIELANGDKKK